MEQERDDHQLRQVNDTAAVLQDELLKAADRERHLQIQLDKMTDDASQLRLQLEQLSIEYNDFKRHNAFQWEHEMKQRNSEFNQFQLCNSCSSYVCVFLQCP